MFIIYYNVYNLILNLKIAYKMTIIPVTFALVNGGRSIIIEFTAEEDCKKSVLGNAIYCGESPVGGKPWKNRKFIDTKKDGKVVMTTITVNYLPDLQFAIMQNYVYSITKM
jgi:hypothetical protein